MDLVSLHVCKIRGTKYKAELEFAKQSALPNFNQQVHTLLKKLLNTEVYNEGETGRAREKPEISFKHLERIISF